MASLSHQSFANTTTPYWASAVEPTSLVSPLQIVDNPSVPTRKMELTTGDTTSSILFSDMAGTDVVGIEFTRLAAPGVDRIDFDVGNVNPGLSIRSSVIVSRLPVEVQGINSTNAFRIENGAATTTLKTATSIPITFSNTVNAPIQVGANVLLDGTGGSVQLASGSLEAELNAGDLNFISGGQLIGTVGASGTSMYMNCLGSLPASGGVVVNQFSGCDLSFRDGPSVPTYNIRAIGSDLVITASQFAPIPDIPAITIATNGQVSIPDLISTSSVPIGGIIMYSGSLLAIPVNYSVCDGTNGTPDLRDRFILAEGTLAQGTTGGSSTIDVTQLPSHTHGVNDPTHTHLLSEPNALASTNNPSLSGPAAPGQNYANIAGASPQSIVAVGTGITIQSTPAALPYAPPFFVLTFLMRMI